MFVILNPQTILSRTCCFLLFVGTHHMRLHATNAHTNAQYACAEIVDDRQPRLGRALHLRVGHARSAPGTGNPNRLANPIAGNRSTIAADRQRCAHRAGGRPARPDSDVHPRLGKPNGARDQRERGGRDDGHLVVLPHGGRGTADGAQRNGAGECGVHERCGQQRRGPRAQGDPGRAPSGHRARSGHDRVQHMQGHRGGRK